MPVLRFPNFTDKTGDVAIDRIWIPVGNQAKGGSLTHITLREFLAEPARYLTLPDKGKIRGGSLLAKRDSHALVSAQATFLPIPQSGEATFWPVIFNYQSTETEPRRADLAGHPPGHQRHHRGQRPRHGQRPTAGASACSSTRAASGPR